MIRLICVGALCAAGAAHAETGEEASARSQRMLEDAASVSKSYYGSKPPPAPAWQPGELRKGVSVDPGEVAARYRDLSRLQGANSDHDLLIFVSASMPQQTLRLLGQQAKRAGAIIEFRGLRLGLKKGGLQDMEQFLKPVVETGATVQIDPDAFRRYQVEVVPTFVVARRFEGCDATTCPIEAAMVAGDVTLDYALDHLISQGGVLGNLARGHLAKMKETVR